MTHTTPQTACMALLGACTAPCSVDVPSTNPRTFGGLKIETPNGENAPFSRPLHDHIPSKNVQSSTGINSCAVSVIHGGLHNCIERGGWLERQPLSSCRRFIDALRRNPQRQPAHDTRGGGPLCESLFNTIHVCNAVLYSS